jgi:TonB-dependent starch-binding outer membrane protein SusC
MHLKALCKYPLWKWRLPKQTLLIMKFTAILLLVACLQVTAKGYSQNVTLSERNAPLQKIFKEIHKQTGFQFFYEDELLSQAGKIDITVKDAPLDDVLSLCFKNLPLTYTIVNKTIVVRIRDEKLIVIEEPLPPIDIRGRVVNENGEPVVATVTIKGTKKTVATNDNGEFEIKGVDDNATLVISAINIEDFEIKVSGRTDLGQVNVKTKISSIPETVVIGYGTAKRKDLTGSVSSININEVKNVPAISFDNVMAGKSAGVQITKADGSPGGAVRIRIRGGSSLIGTNDPLYIIDGVPVTIENKYVGVTDMTNPVENYGGENARNSTVSQSFMRGLNNLAGLNIDDIESIDILKDASATAIYGSKAANGVVIITTKKGKLNQKPVLEVNYYAGMSNARKEKLLSREQYRMILQEAAKNRVDGDIRLNRTPDANAVAINNNPDVLGAANTDWLDLVLRTGFSQNVNVSVRGGGSGSRYYTSLAYTSQQGTLISTDFKRVSGKLNLDNEITDRFRVITNLDYGFTINKITNGLYASALLAPPTLSPYNADGSFLNFDTYNRGSDFGLQNPMALATGINQGKTISLIGSLSAEYDILKDLRYKSTTAVNFSSYRQRNYIPSYLEIANPNSQGGTGSGGGVGSESTNESTDAFFENTLTWNHEFNRDNRLNLLAGTSWEKYRSSFFSAEGKGFPNDNYLNNLTSAAAATTVRGSNPFGQNSLLSFYIRANYALREKYLLTFTGRNDISSKFAEGKQAGYFPSGAIAWRVSEENFLKRATWIDELKLRVSAGYTGSQSIGDNLFRTLFTATSYAGAPAIVPTQLGNDQIKWEKTLQKDVGIDFAFFKQRLRGTLGYYDKTTEGLLLNITPPPSYAFGSVIMNVATIRNRGLELDIRGDIFNAKIFQWNSAFNISGNRSKVTHVNGGPFSDPNNRNSLNLGTSIVREGDPLGLLYGRVALGIFQTQKEVDDFLAKVGSLATLFNRYLGVGDIKYDTGSAASGIISYMNVIGHAQPKFYGGFTNTFSYKGFSLITHMTFAYGHEMLYQLNNSNREVINVVNKGVGILDRWTPSNPTNTRERLIWGITAFRNNLDVFEASYLKLRSVTLGYDIPKPLLDRLKMRMASFYISATNLFTITNYPGLDPEVSDNPFSIIGGSRDVSSYPTTREFTIGIRFGL